MGLFWIIVSSLLAGSGGLFCLIYYLKKGQFDEGEDVKYQMFHEDDIPK